MKMKLMTSVHWLQITHYKKKPRSAGHGKGSIGAKLHYGTRITRKLVNLTRNITQSCESI